VSRRIPHAPPSEISIHRDGAQRMGFFTDTTVCIGCKACEVACKQWNDLPADGTEFRRGGSYDHTGSLGATTWRHVRFIELLEPSPLIREEADRALAAGLGGQMPDLAAVAGGPLATGDAETPLLDIVAMAQAGGYVNPIAAAARDPSGDGLHFDFDLVTAAQDRDHWVFMSNVCKHCTHAGCMDACPTGALIRTEFETVIVQPDVCNGCGYCVPACPFGVIDRSHDDGRAAKCTLCYDRLEDGLEPACAKSCPTDSIQFGTYEDLLDVAERRVAELHQRGLSGAYLYGAGDSVSDELAGGLGAFFLLTEPPERYGLPATADSPVQQNVVPATIAAMGAAVTAAAFVVAAIGVRRDRPPVGGGPGALAWLAIGATGYEAVREFRAQARGRGRRRDQT
jgi:formate dehydrogenase iron-sulfur subunit